MNCRICANRITSKNRSPLKGVCKQDFRILSREQFADLTGNDPANRPLRLRNSVNDATPDVSVEFREEYKQSFRPVAPSGDKVVEVELSAEDRKLLTQLRVKRAKTIREPMLDESKLNPALGAPVQGQGVVEEELSVSLSQGDVRLLAEIRARRRFGLPSPVIVPRYVRSAAAVKTWDDCFSFLDYCLARAAPAAELGRV